MAEKKKGEKSGSARRSKVPKKNSSKKSIPPAPRNDKNQFWSLVLFAFGILVMLMALVKGSAGWLAVHNFLLGMFGVSVFFVPVIMIYCSIQLGLEKSRENITKRALWGAVLAVLSSSAIQIFAVGQLPGANFTEHVKNLYLDGRILEGGGVASILVAGILLKVFGGLGAKIITVLMFFVVGMLVTNKGLIEFLEFITRPFRNFGNFLKGVYSVFMGGQFTEYLDDDDYDDDAEKKSFAEDIEAIEMVSGEEVRIDDHSETEGNIADIINSIKSRKNKSLADDYGIDIPLESDSLIQSEQYTPAFPENEAEVHGLSEPETVQSEEQFTDFDLDSLIDKAVKSKSEKMKNASAFETVADEEREQKPDYKLPSLELLAKPVTNGNNEDAAAEMREKADIIVNTLKSFNVEVKIRDIFRGPSITRYEVQPGVGIQIKKIKNLEDDIALSLAAQGVRIEAPVPGKSVVGIEVPNLNKDTVTIREMLSSDEFRNNKSKLTFAVGKDIAGNTILGDVAKMPHVIIAGTTGSGKSVCTRSIIMSILYNAKPNEVRFILIDPKIVEFKVFEGIPHLLIPIVTDAKKAAGALNWAVNEMMKRYRTFADASVNDLKSYNVYAQENGLEPMAQIVIFIDELADMMLVAKNEVENYICRLAQMGRASGMHLVVATQRPTTDVITGLIKANIPSRIALSVMSQIDSRTIIDQPGADKLLGNGDMLYLPIGTTKPVRVQGCFASNKDINETLSYIKSQCECMYDDSIVDAVENFVPQGKGSSNDDISDGAVAGSDEDYILKAMEVAVNNGQISTSMLQRKLKLGYARAARIVDELEERGVVGQSEGAKPRKVLMSRMQFDEYKLRMREQ